MTYYFKQMQSRYLSHGKIMQKLVE